MDNYLQLIDLPTPHHATDELALRSGSTATLLSPPVMTPPPVRIPEPRRAAPSSSETPSEPRRRLLPRRLQVILWIVGAVTGLYGAQHLLFPNPGVTPASAWQWAY